MSRPALMMRRAFFNISHAQGSLLDSCGPCFGPRHAACHRYWVTCLAPGHLGQLGGEPSI